MRTDTQCIGTSSMRLLYITSIPTASCVSAGPHAAGLHPAPRDGRPRRLQEELRPLGPRLRRPRPRRHVTASWACPAMKTKRLRRHRRRRPPSPPPPQQQQHSHYFNDICRHMSEEAVAPIPPGHTQQSMAAAEQRPTPSQQL